jgi:hypothetical protein
MWPCKTFLISKFSYLLFCNLTHQTEAGTVQIGGGTTNSKPPGSIIMIGRSKTGSNSQITFITLFSSSAQLCCAFYQRPQTEQNMQEKNNFAEPNQHTLTLCYSILMCRVTYWAQVGMFWDVQVASKCAQPLSECLLMGCNTGYKVTMEGPPNLFDIMIHKWATMKTKKSTK